MRKVKYKNPYGLEKETIWNLNFPIIALNNRTFEAVVGYVIDLFNIEYRGTHGFYLKTEK